MKIFQIIFHHDIVLDNRIKRENYYFIKSTRRILTNVNEKWINLPFSFTNGRRISSLPFLNRTKVGNCLLNVEVLILNFWAVSGLRARSILMKRKFSRQYLFDNSEKTLENSTHGGLQAVYNSTSITDCFSFASSSSKSSPLRYDMFSGPWYVGSGSKSNWTDRFRMRIWIEKFDYFTIYLNDFILVNQT